MREGLQSMLLEFFLPFSVGVIAAVLYRVWAIAGMLVFFPAEEKHRLRATEDTLYFEFQAPNRFKTTILDGTEDDLRWEKVDGKIWVQT